MSYFTENQLELLWPGLIANFVTIVTVVFCRGANGSLQLHEYPKPMVRLACGTERGRR